MQQTCDIVALASHKDPSAHSPSRDTASDSGMAAGTSAAASGSGGGGDGSRQGLGADGATGLAKSAGGAATTGEQGRAARAQRD